MPPRTHRGTGRPECPAPAGNKESRASGRPGARQRAVPAGDTLALNPALSVGEAYMDGRLVIEEGSLYGFLDVVARNYGTTGHSRWLAFVEQLGKGLKQSNPLGRARRNVAHHYDLSSEFFDIFLDRDRQYSCAYFKSADESLEAAQENKKRHIAAKLCLDRPGLKVLDIGSGWGGLALYLAEVFGAEVTGVTLSEEQHSSSMQRAANSSAGGRVRFELRDYRELGGRFDRIVSVGMLEHVGRRNYAEFFARIRALLSDDGVALIHSIGYADTPAPINPFIRKYIFPGADLPALSEVLSAVEPTRLEDRKTWKEAGALLRPAPGRRRDEHRHLMAWEEMTPRIGAALDRLSQEWSRERLQNVVGPRITAQAA